MSTPVSSPGKVSAAIRSRGAILKPLSRLAPAVPELRLEAAPPAQAVQMPPARDLSEHPLELEQPWVQTRFGWVSTWRAVKELFDASQLVFPREVNHHNAKRVRFIFRALRDFSLWRHWQGFLKSSPFGEVARHFARIYEKPFRPYLHKDLTRAECLRVLREHYLFLQRHAPGALIEAMVRNKPFILNEHSVGELEEPLILNLTYARHMQQEGELTLSLGRSDSVDTLHDHRWITALTFVVQYGASGWEMLVGGIQGGHTEHSKEDMKLATHVFHGMRPKHLLLHLLREIAASWGISRIYAISDDAHCYMRRRYRGRITIKSSYAELWTDVGGRPAANGFYSLPLGQGQRSLEDVPSRKRAQYRRRYALLERMDAEVRGKLSIKP
ncbi:MAG TPA: DUF535 family protein [Gammaproteobacteria bacterium]|nr:DUF535 family protein [Gammaproteobacteria bacterium]